MAQEQTAVRERQRQSFKKPELYQIIINNDDVTPMDFVIDILETVFFKLRKDAETIMLKAHREGRAVVGVYSYDVAKSKLQRAQSIIHKTHYPLELTIEPA